MESPCCQDCRYCWQDDRSSVYRRPPFFFCRRKGSFFSRNYQIGEGTRKPGMEQPLHVWVPSIAPSGMAFYQGDRFPRWRGDLFVGALRGQMLVRLRFDD